MPARVKRDPLGFLIIFSILYLFWILVSGQVDWQHLTVGFGLSFMLTYYWADVLFDQERGTRFTFRQVVMLACYLMLLVLEIIKANIHVALIVLNPRLPISPGLVQLKTPLKRDLCRVLYANSITLTPGTITVKLEQDQLLVHALTRDNAEEVEHWYLQDKMAVIEGND